MSRDANARDKLLFQPANFRSHRKDVADLADDIAANVEGLEVALTAACRAVGPWTGDVLHAHQPSGGAAFAFTQAINEFLDLLYDCAHGRGRPALKACRSLFELLVTVKDIVPDADARQRYEDHRWVVFSLDAELESKRPGRRKGDNHRRKKAVAYVKPHVDQVIAKYGRRFRLSWRRDNLADAAARHGLSEDYDFYRLASGVLHGSSGGVLGQYALDMRGVEPVPVHRTGPALSLCPEAFRRGVGYFRATVMDSEVLAGTGATEELLTACDRLLGLADRYEEFLVDLDGQWWANFPRGHVEAVACIDLCGGCRWFLHYTARNEVREAVSPDNVSPLQKEAIESAIRARRDGCEIPGVPSDGVMTIHVLGARLRPKPGAKWQPAALYLQQGVPTVDGTGGFSVSEALPDWLDE